MPAYSLPLTHAALSPGAPVHLPSDTFREFGKRITGAEAQRLRDQAMDDAVLNGDRPRGNSPW